MDAGFFVFFYMNSIIANFTPICLNTILKFVANITGIMKYPQKIVKTVNKEFHLCLNFARPLQFGQYRKFSMYIANKISYCFIFGIVNLNCSASILKKIMKMF